MSGAYKVCKVCDKEYKYCKTNRPGNLFRWQDVACCPEHGAIYFERILESRKPKTEIEAPVVEENEEIKEPFYSFDEYDFDEEEEDDDEEDDFEDEDE